MGWELKYGEYFITFHQILKINIFSTLLPNFYWINHSWGADAVLYAAFSQFGFFGLSLGGAIVITLIFYFYAKAARLSLEQCLVLFPVLFYLEQQMNKTALRPELMSLLFQGILIYLLSGYDHGRKKIIFFALPLFFLWVNVHGEFILGLGTFCLWILLRTGKSLFIDTAKIKEEKKSADYSYPLVAFCSSALVVLINPFGIGIYWETFSHFFNPNLHYITEWLPLQAFSQDWWNLISTGVLYLTGIFLLRKKLRSHVTFTAIAVLFLILSLFSRRYIWPFYYLTLPVFALWLSYIFPGLKTMSKTALVTVLCILTVVVFAVKYPFSNYTSMNWDTYCHVDLCSANAAKFLLSHHLNTDPHLLTDYNLGGWLIWNFPQIKPTIDGRMTIWIGQNGFNPLNHYMSYVNNNEDIDTSSYDLVFMSEVANPLLEKFVTDKKWKIIYIDHNVVILQKLHTS